MSNKILKQKLALKGKGASIGRAKGQAKVVFCLAEAEKLNQGDILVTKMTEPSMTAAILKASAIVTNTGGLTCHAAIISRELGIPCVVATGGATKKLKDGMIIEVDGEKGEVYFAS